MINSDSKNTSTNFFAQNILNKALLYVLETTFWKIFLENIFVKRLFQAPSSFTVFEMEYFLTTPSSPSKSPKFWGVNIGHGDQPPPPRNLNLAPIKTIWLDLCISFSFTLKDGYLKHISNEINYQKTFEIQRNKL